MKLGRASLYIQAGLIVLSLALGTRSQAATFYVSADGSDSIGVGSSSAPWKTTAKAFAQGGGHAYVFKDGLYDYSGGAIANPPSGSSETYTVIRAENDGGAILRGHSTAITLNQKSFIRIEGLTIKDGTGSHAIYVTDSHHIKLMRLGIKNGIAWNAQYGNVIELSSLNGITGTKDCLLEDVWVTGSMRYGILLGGTGGYTERNVLRRCVVRFDGGGSPEPHAGISNYGATSGIQGARDNVLQNCIALDFNVPNNPSGEGVYAGFYNPHAATNIDFYGCIALKTRERGFLLNEDAGSNGNDMFNCVVWGAQTDGIAGQRSLSTGSVVEQVTVGASGGRGYWSYSGMRGTVRNSLFYANAGDNVGITSETHNQYWQDAPGGAQPLVSDPLSKFIAQVEPDSPSFGSGLNGQNRGATIVKKYGVSGTLHGEPGYDALTEENLWPWPQQERIQALFAEPDFTLSIPLNDEARGFASSDTSLTEYIWEQLGNPNPFPSTPDVTAPFVSISSPAAGSTVSGDILIKASASDDVLIRKVEFRVDGFLLHTAYSVPYQFVWDTYGEMNAEHEVTAAAHDYAGNVAIATSSLTVLNFPDLIPPSVAITAPLDGSTVRGTTVVASAAADDQKVRAVSFFVDDIFQSSDTIAPFAFDWNTWSVSEGTHSVSVQAVDVGGNFSAGSTVTVRVENIDLVPPSVSLTSPMDGATVRGSTTVRASAADNFDVARVVFFLDGIPASTDTSSPFSFSWNTAASSEGVHVLSALAFDTTGYSTLSATRAVTVENIDIVPPAVALTAPWDGAEVRGSTTVRASASDNFGVTRVQFLVNGTVRSTDTTSPYSYAWNTALESTGTYSLEARAFDAAGFVSSHSLTALVVDGTPPAVSISSPSNGSVLTGPVTLLAEASDFISVDHVQFLVDGTVAASTPAAASTAAAQYAFEWNASTSVIGAHILAVRAFDSAGNQGTSSVSVTVPDSVFPNCTLLTPMDGSTVSANVTVAASASDNVGIEFVRFTVDGATRTDVFSSPYSFSWNTTFESTGTRLLSAQAFDAAGNASGSTIAVTVRDVTAPTVSISTPSHLSFVSGLTSVAVNAGDFIGVDRVEFLIDGQLTATASASPYVFAWDASTQTIGTHRLAARAYDAAGNHRTSSVTVTVPDTVPPALALTFPADGAEVTGIVSIQASASDNIAVTQVLFAVDGAVRSTDIAAPYSYDWNTANETPGAHVLALTAYDARQNFVQTHATVTVRDIAPPTVNLTQPASGTEVLGRVALAASASDNVAVTTVQFLLNGGVIAEIFDAPYQFVWDASTAAAGAHVIAARAFDAAGNQGISSAAVSVPDTSSPTIALTSPADGAGVFGSVAVTASASDDVGVDRVVFIVDGVARSTDVAFPYDFIWNSTAETIGAHLLTAQAFDARGNAAISTVTLTVLDVSSPSAAILTPANGAGISGTVSVSASASDNAGITFLEILTDGLAAASSSSDTIHFNWNTSSASIGIHSLAARAWDAAGNHHTSSISVTVQDINVPVISITAPAQGSGVSGLVGLFADAADNVGVSRVEFMVDGWVRSTVSAAPYSYVWDSSSETIGAHDLAARAFDAEGNSSVSAVHVFVLDVASPSVTIVSPAAGAALSGSVNVTALASDNSGVARVEFAIDGITRSTDSSAPYEFLWDVSAEPVGTRVLSARAFDAAGNHRASSAAVTILDVESPSISLHQPVHGSTASGWINVSAGAQDNAGVALVQFWIDGVVGPLFTQPPYGFAWNAATATLGAHQFLARAYDAAGNHAETSASVWIPDASSPTVSVSSPPAGSVVSGIARVTASASDNAAVDRVQFLVDGAVRSTDTAAPYSFDWDTLVESSGPHVLGARAFDASGNQAISEISVFVENPDIIPPQVFLSSPTAGAVLAATFTLVASASDDRAIDRVVFILDGVGISTDAATPFERLWNPLTVSSGAHVIGARAFDSAGNSSAAFAAVTVEYPAQPDLPPATTSAPPASSTTTVDASSPAVTIVSPADGDGIYGMTSITAGASDDQAVVRVAFYLDGTLIAEDAESPYAASIDEKGVSAGPHTITAAAWDAAGNKSSASITLHRHSTKLLGVNARGGSAAPQSPGAASTAAVTMIIDSSDPVFASDSFEATIHLPSGSRTFTFSRGPGGRPASEISDGSASLAELRSLSSREISLTVSSRVVTASVVTGVIVPGVGGTIYESPDGGAHVAFAADAVSDEAEILIDMEPISGQILRDEALARQGLLSVGTGRDIRFTSSGTLKSATLILPYDSSLIPAGRSANEIAIAYYNPATGAWEIQNSAITGIMVQAVVTHFSLYKPVLHAPSPSAAGAVVRETYVFPNPAFAPDEPVIRVAAGAGTEVELRIYDSAGREAHSAVFAGHPSGSVDYVWSGPKASGMYLASIESRTSGEKPSRLRLRFAVVR